MTSDPVPGPLTRFLRYTTQSEPVLSASVVAAFVLAALDRHFHLTDDDLQLIGLLATPIVAGLLARLSAWSPRSAGVAIGNAYQEGLTDGSIQPAAPTPGND